MRSRLVAAVLAPFFVLAGASTSRADFAEVSGPGEEPFLLEADGWSWEDLATEGLSGISYTVYRSPSPSGGFAAVLDGHVAAGWEGDAALPSDEGASVFHYLVTANDGTADDSPGETSDGALRDVELPERCPTGAAPLAQLPALRLEEVARLAEPMFLASPPGDHDRLFVAEREGVIRIVEDGSVLSTPFLDISGSVVTGSERGLLGLAFHPDFESNGLFYVHYSTPGCADHCAHVSELSVSADPDVADPATERVLLEVSQPRGNHDGGWIGFGPDGFLYIAFGDGGGAGDGFGNGQNLETLLGSMLRIDVDGRDAGLEYAIPPDNPFVGMGRARPEVWSYGLRNPWRNSFDRETGDFHVADVGQNEWEEVNVATAASGGGAGLNFGWNVMEGLHCFEPPAGCDMSGLTLPVHEYPHAPSDCFGEAGSITGGYVYRGCRMPALSGTYFFADYCIGRTWSFVFDGLSATEVTERSELSLPAVISFGEDAAGEMYVLVQDGRVLRIVPDV